MLFIIKKIRIIKYNEKLLDNESQKQFLIKQFYIKLIF